jgi:hypothetical protein
MHIHIFCFLMNLPLCPRFPFICWSWPVYSLRYLGVYPLGDRYSNNCMSVYLHMDSSDDAPRESGRLVQLNLSIMDQKHGKRFRKRTPGSAFLS